MAGWLIHLEIEGLEFCLGAVGVLRSLQFTGVFLFNFGRALPLLCKEKLRMYLQINKNIATRLRKLSFLCLRLAHAFQLSHLFHFCSLPCYLATTLTSILLKKPAKLKEDHQEVAKSSFPLSTPPISNPLHQYQVSIPLL